jgi:hypothetical protein
LEGNFKGIAEGSMEGNCNWKGILDGSLEGSLDDIVDRSLESDCNCEGIADGSVEGNWDCEGITEGDFEGDFEGIEDGSLEGDCDCKGISEGSLEGEALREELGMTNGLAESEELGEELGLADGLTEGKALKEEIIWSYAPPFVAGTVSHQIVAPAVFPSFCGLLLAYHHCPCSFSIVLYFPVVGAFAVSFVSPATNGYRLDFIILVSLRHGCRRHRGHCDHCISIPVSPNALWLVVGTVALSFVSPSTTCQRSD